jgi:hypothetical protein
MDLVPACISLSTTPVKESIVFWTGVAASPLFKINPVHPQNQADTDFTKSQSYYWFAAPLAFTVAAVTIYKKEHLQNHWFFGIPIFVSLLTYSTDLLFGITLGMVLFSNQSQDLWKAFTGNSSKTTKKIHLNILRLKEEALAIVGRVPPNRVMPDLWDRFTAESQIKLLEHFLERIGSLGLEPSVFELQMGRIKVLESIEKQPTSKQRN